MILLVCNKLFPPTVLCWLCTTLVVCTVEVTGVDACNTECPDNLIVCNPAEVDTCICWCGKCCWFDCSRLWPTAGLTTATDLILTFGFLGTLVAGVLVMLNLGRTTSSGLLGGAMVGRVVVVVVGAVVVTMLSIAVLDTGLEELLFMVMVMGMLLGACRTFWGCCWGC